jgi:drug/metabolite transporter (DMT)-like permease
MLAATPAFGCFAFMTGRMRDTAATLRNGPALGLLTLGAFWGPFLGVSSFIHSLKYVPATMTQTITSLVPVLIIPFAIVVRKEHVSPRAILGGCVAVTGVWVLILGGSAGW